ncbi:MAG: hypothetical protein V1837_05340 [Candidatus Woesearchaeota archaeon]
MELNIETRTIAVMQQELRDELEGSLEEIKFIVANAKDLAGLESELEPFYLDLQPTEKDKAIFKASLGLSYKIHVQRLEQARDSGHSAIIHPLQVGYISQELGLSPMHVGIDFLHDAVIENDYKHRIENMKMVIEVFNSINKGLGNYMRYYLIALSAKPNNDPIKKKDDLMQKIVRMGSNANRQGLFPGEDTLANLLIHKQCDNVGNLYDLRFMSGKNGIESVVRQANKLRISDKYLSLVREKGINMIGKSGLDFNEYTQILVKEHKERLHLQ